MAHFQRLIRLVVFFVLGIMLGGLSVSVFAETIPATPFPSPIPNQPYSCGPAGGTAGPYLAYGPDALTACYASGLLYDAVYHTGPYNPANLAGSAYSMYKPKGVSIGQFSFTTVTPHCPNVGNYSVSGSNCVSSSYYCITPASGANYLLSGATCTRPDTACTSTAAVAADTNYDMGFAPVDGTDRLTVGGSAGTACISGCLATFVGVALPRVLVSGLYHYYQRGHYTYMGKGAQDTCAAGIGGIPGPATSSTTVPPDSCAAGQTMGQVNGANVCVTAGFTPVDSSEAGKQAAAAAAATAAITAAQTAVNGAAPPIGTTLATNAQTAYNAATTGIAAAVVASSAGATATQANAAAAAATAAATAANTAAPGSAAASNALAWAQFAQEAATRANGLPAGSAGQIAAANQAAQGAANASADAAAAAKTPSSSAGAAGGTPVAPGTPVDDPLKTFCSTHPTSTLCSDAATGSASASSVCTSPPSCTGDAIQCAQLQQSWDIQCAVTYTADATSALGRAVLDGADPLASTLPTAANGTTVAVDTTMTAAMGSRTLTSTCIASPSFTIAGKSFTLDLTKYCETMGYAGNLFVSLCMLAGVRIIGKGGA